MKATLNKPPDPNRFIHFSDAVADGKVDHLWREPESILEDRFSSTYAGVLRPGIKVPKKDGPHRLTPGEQQTYQRMMTDHISPREIEKKLGKELEPENVGYFSVYGSECRTNPEHADLIRSLYGNEQGEIQRLRITFVDNDWWEIIPHKLMAFRKRGLYCSSEPKNGQLIATRDTSMDGPEEGIPNRPFRRKLKQLPCVPDECPIYQKNYCKLSAILHFVIIGVPGTDVWRVPTNSWHSVRGILKKIRRFNKALSRRDRELMGIPFMLYKYKGEVSIWDSKRQSKQKVNRWLFGIEAPEFPLADLLVKQAGFDVNGSLELPMIPNRPVREKINPTRAVPISDQNEIKEIVKADEAAGAPPSLETLGESPLPEGPEEPAVSPAESITSAPPHADMAENSETDDAVMKALREKIQNEIEPKGAVPIEVITCCAQRLRKSRLSELTFQELVELDGSIEGYKLHPWAQCSRCPSLLHPEVKGYSMKHYQEALCRECRRKEAPHSTLPPILSAERKPTGQVQGAGF